MAIYTCSDLEVGFFNESRNISKVRCGSESIILLGIFLMIHDWKVLFAAFRFIIPENFLFSSSALTKYAKIGKKDFLQCKGIPSIWFHCIRSATIFRGPVRVSTFPALAVTSIPFLWTGHIWGSRDTFSSFLNLVELFSGINVIIVTRSPPKECRLCGIFRSCLTNPIRFSGLSLAFQWWSLAHDDFGLILVSSWWQPR